MLSYVQSIFIYGKSGKLNVVEKTLNLKSFNLALKGFLTLKSLTLDAGLF